MNSNGKPRVLIFIVAYQAQDTIAAVLTRIPAELAEKYDIEILIIDDSSSDLTFDRGLNIARSKSLPYKIHVLFNPINQGYGGNQKIGYHYAIENNFDYVALIHGDGQYAPECLGNLLSSFEDSSVAAVFGSRMLTRGEALSGGMPLYKYIGNKILTWFENHMLKSSLSEFHSGYRIYSVPALKSIPFDLNTNDFHFDTEIIVQFVFSGLRIIEQPIPTYYGDEICRVNGLKYALDVTITVIKARLQGVGLYYDPKFDCLNRSNKQYKLKLGYPSPHSEVLRHIPKGARVLDLGCAGGYVGSLLRERLGCKVTGVDCFPLASANILEAFVDHDLNAGMPLLDFSQFDYILMLDVIEHLSAPEKFIQSLCNSLEKYPHTTIIASTGNVAFFITRLMLLFGQFNYGKRGILDITHSRLFTFNSFCRLFNQNGMKVDFKLGLPGPYPLAIGDNSFSKLLIVINTLLIKICRGMFSYQVFITAKTQPTLAYLLSQSITHSEIRSAKLKND